MSKQNLKDLIAPPDIEEFSEDQMGVLAEAINRLLAKQAEIGEAAAALKVLEEEERKINQSEVPAIMENLGFESITLKDGRKVAVKDSQQINIPASVKNQAFNWLDKNGHGDLIKTLVATKFNRGEGSKAAKLLELLQKKQYDASLTETVNANTLKAWGRKELEAGHKLPASMFKVHVVKITTVK